MKTIWFDITNVPHVHFFKPIIKNLEKNFNLIFTLKNFAETIPLFEKVIGRPYKAVGSHKGNLKILKVVGVFERTLKLVNIINTFDLKISIGGDSSNLVAKLKGKKSITFDDNEIAPNWRYSWLSDFAFWPDAVPLEVLEKQGFKRDKLFFYQGYKEDIYIADYQPDPDFFKKVPFRNFVVVRAENIQANYVNTKDSIVPRLLRKLASEGYNVIFLPRYKGDENYARGIPNIFIPSEVLNGLDLCYYAKGVLSGAGTLTREAACMGVPSVSFFSGKKLLSVDKKMIKEGMVFHSRNINDIINYLKISKRKQIDLSRSKKVKAKIIEKLDIVIEKLLEN